MTLDQLRAIMPCSAGRLAIYGSTFLAAMNEYGITTPRRQAAYIAQVAVESCELRYVRELGDCSRYDGRADLGNTQPGDGNLFRGGGWLDLTGRGNYLRCEVALHIPLTANPSLIETPEVAARSAGWFWQTHGINELADIDSFFEITHRINGGYTGGDHRLAYYLRARTVLGL